MKKYLSTHPPTLQGFGKSVAVLDIRSEKVRERKVKELRIKNWGYEIALYYWIGQYWDDLIVYRDEKYRSENASEVNTYMVKHSHSSLGRPKECLNIAVEVFGTNSIDPALLFDEEFLEKIFQLRPFKWNP